VAVKPSGDLRIRADIGAELGLGSSTSVQLNASCRSLISKGAGVETRMGEFYGASSSVFDASKNPAVYGGPANGQGPGQTGSGSGNAYTYQMWATAGTAGVSMGLVTAIPMKPSTTYEVDYDVTINGTSAGTRLTLARNRYGKSSGVSSTMVVSNDIDQEWGLAQSGYYLNGGSYYTANDGSWQWISGSTSFRASAKFQFTTNAYDWAGVGLMLIQNKVGNNNSQNGSCTIHKCIISEV